MSGPQRAIGPDELAALFRPFERRRGVTLAVSGGADSTALMQLAARWRDAGGATPLFIATVDHGIRPEAAAECARVCLMATRLNLPSTVKTWSGAKPSSRLQESARAARWSLLAEAARAYGADAVATAHTLDDQAETVLMRLAHGSAIEGLAAMRPRSCRDGLVRLRPFLTLPKARLLATLREASIDWIEDPSNSDPRFERVRIRRLLAMLAPTGLTSRRLATLAGRALRAAEALETIASSTFDRLAVTTDTAIALDTHAFLVEPAEIRLRMLGRAIRRVGPGNAEEPLRLERLEALDEALTRAAGEGAPLRRTLGGALVTLRARSLCISPEGPRRRGRPRGSES
jgi:tRNA(Ile)-lysidine synthase